MIFTSAVASAGIARAEMSVRLYVRPSVTLWYCIKTEKASVVLSSRSESPNIPVFLIFGTSRNSKGVTPGEGDFWDCSGYELALFDLHATVIPKRCKIGPKLVMITNRSYIYALSIKFQTQRLWLSLNWPWTAIMHSVALHTCISEPTTTT